MNLVTIAIDDLFAYDQFRDSFGVTIQTPNLDRLMEMSVNFENAYASVAICAPSRAATLSGKTAFQTGVQDNFTDFFAVYDVQETWPALIRDNGYFATSAGKVFHSRGVNPVEQEAYSEALVPVKNTLTAPREFTDGGKKWAYTGSDEDFTDYDTAQFGIDFLDRAPEDQDFLLNLGFDHPHTTYFSPARYFDMYPVDQIQIPEHWSQGELSDLPAFAQQFASQPRGGEPFSDLDEWKATVQGYLASISHMDAEVGRFLDALATSEHAGDTAVLLYSDHGYQLGAKDHPVKFTLWEESAKAPMMLFHPDLDGGKTVTTPVSLMDIMPTVLDITGTTIPDGLNGSSLLSFVTGDGEGYDAKPVLTSMYGSFAIRSGDYRYIRYQDGGEELYDLTVDPGQVTNLAVDPTNRPLLDQLQTELLTAAREAGALIDPDVAVLLGTDGADQGVASTTNQQIALGDGDDAYFVYENGTQIIETADGGFDTVYYIGAETFTVPENIERVYATLPNNQLGYVAIQGNDQDNVLYTGYVRGILHGGGGNDHLFGGGWVNHEFNGGAGDDVLIGAKLADLLIGGDGDDSIVGYNKDDQIFAGAGADQVEGGNDADLIYGGEGADNLNGGNGNDRVWGEAGADTIIGEEGDDRLSGGQGNDSLYSGFGDDSVAGDEGDDFIFSVGGNDLLIGGLGRDHVVINDRDGHRVIDPAGSDVADQVELLGQALPDLSLHRIGEDLHIVISEAQSVWIENATSNRDDSVVLTDATYSLGALLDRAVVMDGVPEGYGDQTASGGALGDFFFGHVGRDSYNAKSGDDEVYGGEGADYLNGSNGNDTLFGGADDDELLGGNDNDVIDGGTGSDTAIGGAGADTYVYQFGDGRLLIDDKGFSTGDRLVIEGVGADDISTSTEVHDLILDFSDGGQIRIRSHAIDRGRIEEITADGQAMSGPTVDPTPPPTVVSPVGPIIGTDGNDKLIGTAIDDEITDGGGVDNMIGGAGADTFIMVSDGVADSIKDFELVHDRIDVSDWGVATLDDLGIADGNNGKVIIRAGSEVLSVSDATRSLEAGDFAVQHFIFGATVFEIIGTDQNDKLIAGGGDQILRDGAGKDNLWGGAGSDTFVFDADGVADGIRDWEVGIDRMDVRAWGAAAFDDLKISQSKGGKVVVRYEGEVLSVTNSDRSLTVDALTEDAFLF